MACASDVEFGELIMRTKQETERERWIVGLRREREGLSHLDRAT